MKQKVVAIWSGGLDSTTMVYELLEKYGRENVFTLSFNYGQKHSKELDCVKKLSSLNKIHNKTVDISTISDLINNSSLTSKQSIPEGMYDDANMKSTVVPNRNMIMISIAAGYGANIGADCVYYAAHAGDHAIYPDCRPEFVNAVNLAVAMGNYVSPLIKSPYIAKTKMQIVKHGLHLHVPYQYTWSCYKGGKTPCGKCGTCVERTEAFYMNAAADPLYTSVEWTTAVDNYLKFKHKQVKLSPVERFLNRLGGR